MKTGPTYFFSLSILISAPLLTSSQRAEACSSAPFSRIEQSTSESTGVRFLTVKEGATVARNAAFLLATKQTASEAKMSPPLFTLTKGNEQVPVRAEVKASASLGDPRHITLFVLTPQAELEQGAAYTLTASIGNPSTVNFTASDAAVPPIPPSPAQIVKFQLGRSERYGGPFGTCYQPPYFTGDYAWRADDAVAVVAYQTDQAGAVRRLLGAWRGSGDDELLLASGMAAAEPGQQSCIVLETYAADLSSAKTAPTCVSHLSDGSVGPKSPTEPVGGESTSPAVPPPQELPQGGDGETSSPSGGCSLSPNAQSHTTWPILGLLTALWLRRKRSAHS